MLSFIPRCVLDGILNLIESVSEGFPSYTLEFDMVTDSELARQIGHQFSGRIAILYDRILWHRKTTKKKSDTLWNINLNVIARSMKGMI